VEKETAMRMRTLTLSACLAFAITGLVCAGQPQKRPDAVRSEQAKLYTVTAYCPCKVMTYENDSPWAPWNDPTQDSPFAPWNNEMFRDSPFAPWNGPVSDERDYERWCDHEHIPEHDRGEWK